MSTTFTQQPLTPLSYADLLTSMALGVSTNGWDIVCSYSLSKLNALLAAKYQARNSGIVDTVSFTTPVQTDPFSGGSFTITYAITLDAPVLQFQAGVNGTCVVSMLLSQGTYTVTPVVNGTPGTPATPQTIPANTYTVQVVVPLVAVSGTDTQNGQTVPPTGAGQTFTFGPSNAAQKADVTLQFSTTPQDDWTLTPPSGDTALNTYFLPRLLLYFQSNVSDIAYTLASLQNTTAAQAQNAPPAGDIVIDPASFVFATSGGSVSTPGGNGNGSTDNDAAAYLSLYIATNNNGNTPGNAAPSFQPGDTAILPVPQGYDCSLIFSRNFIQNVYLIPQLQKSGFINATTPGGASAGCAVSADYGRNVAFPSSTLLDGGQIRAYGDAYTLDFQNNPYTFDFTSSNLEIKMTLTASENWNIDTNTGNPAQGGEGWQPGGSGTATVTISLDKNMPLSSISKLDNNTNDFTLDFSISTSDYNISINPGAGSDWWDTDVGNMVASGIKSGLSGALPSVSFPFTGLNYFQATNLLFPGSRVINVDTSVGLAVPCDLLLVGNFV